MYSNEKISSFLRPTFVDVINSLASNYQGSSLTDIFITVDKESGEVAFYDDEENCIVKTVVDAWVEHESDLSDEKVAAVLRSLTTAIDDEHLFDLLDLYKPFSVNYADDNMIVIEELLQINDDSMVQIDNDLLAKFDKEFDDFLDKLLRE